MICQLPANLHDFKLDWYEFHCFGSPTGLWKLNSALLSEVDYVNAIKSTIAETAREYESDEEVDKVLLREM